MDDPVPSKRHAGARAGQVIIVHRIDGRAGASIATSTPRWTYKRAISEQLVLLPRLLVCDLAGVGGLGQHGRRPRTPPADDVGTAAIRLGLIIPEEGCSRGFGPASKARGPA